MQHGTPNMVMDTYQTQFMHDTCPKPVKHGFSESYSWSTQDIHVQLAGNRKCPCPTGG